MSSLPESILKDIARRLQNELKTTCPVDTGRLKTSIKVRKIKAGIVIWMVDYGLYVEFGVKGKGGQRPNPFIRTALQTKLRKIIREEITRRI